MKSFRPRPHLMHFRLNDAYISIRLGLLSTLIRWVFSSKTQRFEIALESGSKFKRIHIVLVWMVENGRNRSKMKTMTKNIAGACVCSMRIEFNLRRTIYCGQSKKDQNENVDSNRSMRFSMTTKTHSKCGQGLSFLIQSKETRLALTRIVFWRKSFMKNKEIPNKQTETLTRTV